MLLGCFRIPYVDGRITERRRHVIFDARDWPNPDDYHEGWDYNWTSSHPKFPNLAVGSDIQPAVLSDECFVSIVKTHYRDLDPTPTMITETVYGHADKSDIVSCLYSRIITDRHIYYAISTEAVRAYSRVDVLPIRDILAAGYNDSMHGKSSIISPPRDESYRRVVPLILTPDSLHRFIDYSCNRLSKSDRQLDNEYDFLAQEDPVLWHELESGIAYRDPWQLAPPMNGGFDDEQPRPLLPKNKKNYRDMVFEVNDPIWDGVIATIVALPVTDFAIKTTLHAAHIHDEPLCLTQFQVNRYDLVWETPARHEHSYRSVNSKLAMLMHVISGVYANLAALSERELVTGDGRSSTITLRRNISGEILIIIDDHVRDVVYRHYTNIVPLVLSTMALGWYD